MLIAKDLNVFYGKLHILWDLSVEIGSESVGLFGPNGAGKTTLINTILGLVRPTSGELVFDGESLSDLDTHERVRRGIAVVLQERELFPLMTVLENLKPITPVDGDPGALVPLGQPAPGPTFRLRPRCRCPLAALAILPQLAHGLVQVTVAGVVPTQPG